MDEVQKAITDHLYDQPSIDGLKYKSSLIALLDDARGAAERDNDGRVRAGCRSSSWLGAMAYLVLLDQIGSCFKAKGHVIGPGSSLAHAIRTFSAIQDDGTVEALYALRCALAHDYSLFNKNTNPLRQHCFTFTADKRSPLVTLPRNPWSGAYSLSTPPNPAEVTVVNLRAVGELTEGIIRELRRLHSVQELEIRISLAEFRFRFGMLYREPTGFTLKDTHSSTTGSPGSSPWVIRD